MIATHLRKLRPRRWNLPQPHPQAKELAGRIKTSPVVAQVLLNRGLHEIEECLSFLRPSLKLLHDPSTLANLTVAADRIARAIREGQRIVIYGDYDVDGITATAILWHAIRLLGGQPHYYIPHRVEEGYGLNTEAVEQICREGAGLIISVDCGVTAIEPAQAARRHGVDLIITDHHEWKHSPVEPTQPLLPDCFTVVHPRLPAEGGGAYPNPNLCGAGVAFKLAWGVGQAVSGSPRVNEEFRAFLCEATALAALGTIADVVPLVGENRILAHFGLGGLKQSKLTGLRALIRSAGLDGQKLDSYHVGFLLAPRLNACGRMGHARLAVQMLTEADPSQAEQIATYLESQNRARQAIERQILDQAMSQVAELGYDNDDHRAVVLGGQGWHPGVIGIVASRIVDRLHKPTVVVAFDGEGGQGSGRSIPGFHLARALEVCSSHLIAHGGHEMAAGLKLEVDRFEDFRQAFTEHAGTAIEPSMLVPTLYLDCLADLTEMTHTLVTDLHRLGPFGHGNRKPVLCCRGLTLAGPPRRVGQKGDHLQLFVQQGDLRMKAIAFNAGAMFDQLKPGVQLDLAVEPHINEWNGRASVELQVKDIRLMPSA